MNKKLAKFLGLFLLAAIAFACIGHIGHTSGQSSTPTCPSEAIASYPPLTAIPPNSKRDQIYLNGVWQFIPAIGTAQPSPPTEGWGKIGVPGDWRKENSESVPGVMKRGTGDAWKDFNGKQLAKAWYQRTVTIPADWQGRRIILSLERVSTDANLYVNNLQCGQVNWPYGAIDITNVVQPGTETTLSLLVVAAADEDEKLVIMGPNEIYSTEATLASRGIIGEVRLVSIPKGAYISDVFVQPSTRKQQVQLDIELSDISQASTVDIIATLLDEKGEVEQQFTTTSRVEAKPTQTLQVAWDWANPRLWDVGQPNLYTLRLQVKGNSIDDEYDQSFGFREFWIEGRKFYLNGSEIRLRPIFHNDAWQGWVVGIPEVMDRMIDGYFWAGFNIAELWPWNHDERGRWHFRELFADRADLKGFPIMAPALRMTHLAKSGDWKKGRKQWEQRMVRELRRYRNHPSILLWATNPNYFGHSDDQNPRRIGLKKVEGTLGKKRDRRWQKLFPLGEEVVATIKKHDPTRSVMVHQGAAVGDVYALNSYLNMIELQEREEWLSHWKQYGDMPYMAVEFGTPLHATMMRGRNGFRKAVRSEPLMTEFSAIYFGKEAYELESPAYRNQIRELFVKDREYQSWHNNSELDFAPAFQKLQQLFSTNTWRSWRTFGITGGMIPWHNGHGWEVSSDGRAKINIGSFEPGRRGPYLEQAPKYLWYYFKPEGNIIHPGGNALLQNNRPTLAWIAGGATAFTAKDHSFTAPEKLSKQVVLINDTRSSQEFAFNWEVIVNGQQVKMGEKTGTIDTAKTLFFPIEATLSTPPMEAAIGKNSPLNGEIRLSARIGNQEHQDNFPFRVFQPPTVTASTITMFDPVGKTRRMLEQLGYSVMLWDGKQTDSLLVIGREVLSEGHKLPGDLAAFVGNGGRALVFTQDPEWIQRAIGLRVAPHLSRRVFPVDETHQVVRGLDELDLRDWRGSSTLVEAYRDTTQGGMKLSSAGSPWYGWHWGNRGAVSSAPIEKPHLSSWRPILESEFDLAYTPLMELDYGKGRLIWNTLDLEDHVPLDAAATQLARGILTYAATAPLTSKADRVLLIASDEEAAKLDALGLIYQRANELSEDADLIVIGDRAQVKDDELRQYLSNGGKVFFLPQHDRTILGVKVGEVKNFGGSLTVPKWSEARGLSASDLRSRADYDTWLIQSGGEIAADGLLSRLQVGRGVAVFSQIDPDALNADTQTYLRYTRWRQTREIAQILANLGASFKADENIFKPVQQHRWLNFFASSNNFYHSDYRTDFELGDDPYRYYRW